MQIKKSIDDMRAEIVAVQRAGDYLKEYDLAQEALEQNPGDEYFQYCSVLALSRCNAKQRALDSFYSYKLHLSGDEYVRALEARILKDLAFQSLEKDEPFKSYNTEKFYTAAVTYLREFGSTGGHYSAVNAATLYLFAGDADKSRDLAEMAIEIANKDTGPIYYALATQAEACLLLNRIDDAKKIIREAAVFNEGNLLTRARTYFQLKLVCNYQRINAEILEPLLPETVVHYCGHTFYNHLPISKLEEEDLSSRIRKEISEHHCAVAYGSLMPGADILFAEAVLAQGGELNVWLPFGKENFCEVSVKPAGDDWVQRFHACVKAASTISYVTESDFLGDESLFKLCSNVLMGMAIMRANSLNARVMQLAVWDQDVTRADGGTYSNITKWKGLGYPTVIVQSPPVVAVSDKHNSRGDYPDVRREPHAILFADVRGFSKLSDRDILWYFNVLQPALAKVLDEYRAEVQHVDTWGDAVFLVTRNASTVARIAVGMNEALSEIDQSKLDIDAPLLLRIGLHFGPVYKVYDHLAQCFTYSSNDVTKTARIEPVTPPGEIFGTEPFVAMLETEGTGWANFEYAGTISSAKDFGAFRMFHIRPKYQASALMCSLD